jgi:hypothetical protein
VYNVYFRHRGIPAKFLYAATDWTFWKDTQSGKPYEVILNLHRELGSLPSPRAAAFYHMLTNWERRGHTYSTQ